MPDQESSSSRSAHSLPAANSARKTAFALVALLGISLICLVVAEIVARAYVSVVAKRGKLFRHDETLGWTVLAGLDFARRNASGGIWQVRTNPGGGRSPLEFEDPAKRRILLIGDSFVFGEGVDVEDRFDMRPAMQQDGWSSVNLGVMGYGTDQQMITARAHTDALSEGDALVLVTNGGDFIDNLRQSHSGRAKPWFELHGDELIEHGPDVGLREILRDKLYLWARFMTLLEANKPAYEEERLQHSGELYRAIVTAETRDLRARGVEIVIAHHATEPGRFPQLHVIMQRTLRHICAPEGYTCVGLDRDLKHGTAPRLSYLADGHWSTVGHDRVAATLGPALHEILD